MIVTVTQSNSKPDIFKVTCRREGQAKGRTSRVPYDNTARNAEVAALCEAMRRLYRSNGPTFSLERTISGEKSTSHIFNVRSY